MQTSTYRGYWIGALLGIFLIVLAVFWWSGAFDAWLGQSSSSAEPAFSTPSISGAAEQGRPSTGN